MTESMVRCPACKAEIKLRPGMAKVLKSLRCPKCAVTFALKDAEIVAPPEPVAVAAAAPADSTAGSLSFSCSGCARSMSARPELAGKKMRCKECGVLTAIPGGESPSPDPVAVPASDVPPAPSGAAPDDANPAAAAPMPPAVAPAAAVPAPPPPAPAGSSAAPPAGAEPADVKLNVLVTGATRGIGRAIVDLLRREGHRVFASGRNGGLLETLKKETGCDGAAKDLSTAAAAVELYAEARKTMGRVDVLINNAGFNPGKDPVAKVTEGQIDASFAVNFRAPFLLAREALNDMSARKSGHIVNVVSTVARASMENYSAYASMKYALHGFTLGLIKEAREVGVKVTAVYPGGTDTEFRAARRPEYLRPESAAAMIVRCVTAPADVVVHELVFRPMCETNF